MNVISNIGSHRLNPASISGQSRLEQVQQVLREQQAQRTGMSGAELAALRDYNGSVSGDIEETQGMEPAAGPDESLKVQLPPNPLAPYIRDAEKRAAEAREMTPVKAAEILLGNFEQLDGAADGRKNNLVHTRDLQAVAKGGERYPEDLRRAAQYVLDNPDLLKTLDISNGEDTKVDNRFGRKDFEKYIEENKAPQARPQGPVLPIRPDNAFTVGQTPDVSEAEQTSGEASPEAQAAIDKAGSLVGKHEVSDKDEIQAVTGLDPSEEKWCAAFAMNILEEAGVLDLEGLENRNYTPTIMAWAQEKGIWAEAGSYEPKPGDAVMFDWDGDKTPNHIGIVEKVENGSVHTIEGNTGDSVARKSYDLSSSYILGYLIGGKKS